MAHIINPQPTIKPKNFSLRVFWEKRNEVLIKRGIPAIGDLFMHRMIFEDMKKLDQEIKINFACDAKYFDAVKDHPFIDSLLDTSVEPNDFVASYDTSSACVRYENILGPDASVHRSDIWASQIGLELQSHNMHFHILPELQEWAKTTISNINPNKQPTVLFCPSSVNTNKNINDNQIQMIVNYLRERDCLIFSIHTVTIPILKKLDVPIFTNLAIPQLIALVNQADYIISVDTAFFHCAGGLKRPLLGIFGWANGKVYGKYYDFELIQKHRDNGDWDCGPCGYHFDKCPKKPGGPYPCMTELTEETLKNGIDRMFTRWPKKTA